MWTGRQRIASNALKIVQRLAVRSMFPLWELGGVSA